MTERNFKVTFHFTADVFAFVGIAHKLYYILFSCILYLTSSAHL